MKKFRVKIKNGCILLGEADTDRVFLKFMTLARKLIDAGVEQRQAYDIAQQKYAKYNVAYRIVKNPDGDLNQEQIAERNRQRQLSLYKFCKRLDAAGWTQIKIGEGYFLDSEQALAYWGEQLVSFFLQEHGCPSLEVGIYYNVETSTIESYGSIRFEHYTERMDDVIKFVKEYADFIYPHNQTRADIAKKFLELKQKYGLSVGRESDYGNHEHMNRRA